LPIFTATLKYQQAGSFDFGYIDYSKFTGDIAYTPVNPYDGNNPGQWEFYASDAATGIGITAIADTGTALIYVDQGIVNNYYQGIQTGSYGGMITVPCGESLPDFSLVIGGEVRTAWGYLLNYSPADNNGNCYSGIQSSGGHRRSDSRSRRRSLFNMLADGYAIEGGRQLCFYVFHFA